MQVCTAIFPTRCLSNLEHCVKSLLTNSNTLCEIIIIWDGSRKQFAELPTFPVGKMIVRYVQNPGYDVYGMFNYGASLCKTEFMLLVNDDMYFPANWDQNLVFHEETVVTFLVVEPGYVPVNEKNMQQDFGFSWKEFKQVDFERFVGDYKEKGSVRIDKIGWYMPVIFPKTLFMKAGQYPTEPPFPKAPNDIRFFEKLKSLPNVKFMQVLSPVYHFQRLSQRKKGLLEKLLKR
jgi:hypothetical protein